MIYEKEIANQENRNERKIIIEDVPFLNQIVDKGNYNEMGFENLTEAEHWSKRDCGVVCLEMALRHFLPEIQTNTKELIDLGLQEGAYREDVGWIHDGLTKIAGKFGLEGCRESIGEDVNKIKRYLEEGKLIIASVSHGFEAGKEYKEDDGSIYVVPRGGHLVLVFGVTEENKRVKELILHHPSPYSSYSWPSHIVPLKIFLESFSEKGNIIKLNKPS